MKKTYTVIFHEEWLVEAESKEELGEITRDELQKIGKCEDSYTDIKRAWLEPGLFVVGDEVVVLDPDDPFTQDWKHMFSGSIVTNWGDGDYTVRDQEGDYFIVPARLIEHAGE